MKSPEEHEILRHILRDIEVPQDSDYDLDLAHIPDIERRLPLGFCSRPRAILPPGPRRHPCTQHVRPGSIGQDPGYHPAEP